MSATVSLKGLYHFPGWIIDHIELDYDSVNTVRRWDKDILQRTLPSPVLDNIHSILVDETSIGKGHSYLTVVLNAETGEVLHLAEGKRKSSLEGFFR